MCWEAHSDTFDPILMANETLEPLMFGGDIAVPGVEFDKFVPTFTSTFAASLPHPDAVFTFMDPHYCNNVSDYALDHAFDTPTPSEYSSGTAIATPTRPRSRMPRTCRFISNWPIPKSHQKPPAKTKTKTEPKTSRIGKKRGPYKKTLMRLKMQQLKEQNK